MSPRAQPDLYHALTTPGGVQTCAGFFNALEFHLTRRAARVVSEDSR